MVLVIGWQLSAACSVLAEHRRAWGPLSAHDLHACHVATPMGCCLALLLPAGGPARNRRRGCLSEESAAAKKLDGGRATPPQAAGTLPGDSSQSVARAQQKNACLVTKLVPALAAVVVLVGNPAAL